MEKVVVRVRSGGYPVITGAGIFERLGKALRYHLGGEQLCLVTDSGVAKYYLKMAQELLEKEDYQVSPFVIAEGEESKSLKTVISLYDFLLQKKMDRACSLMALGGGVVGDLTGFVAATYMRGVAYAQIPTSLVGQVDASVGGKTGVNHRLGKNLIGAFYHPKVVYTDVQLLSTLPRRDFLAGLAEVVKYGAIWDEELFAYLEVNLPQILSYDNSALLHIVNSCCAIKAEIVKQDERETGIRAILNFGHTLGHAVETLTNYREYKHGEATAIGMSFAAQLSEKLGLLSAAEAGRLKNLLTRIGLPVELPDLAQQEYLRVLQRDKKSRSGTVNFILTGPLGKATIHPISAAAILAGWKGERAG